MKMNAFSACAAAVALVVAITPWQGMAQAPGSPRTAVASSSEMPAGATGRCRNGAFTTVRDVSSACADRGGVLVTFQVREAPPRPLSSATRASVESNEVVPPRPASPPPPPAGALAANELGAPLAPPVAAAPPPAGIRSVEMTQTPAAARPRGARAQCKDGSYVLVPANAGTCGANGGLAVVFPPERGTPPAPVARAGAPTALPAARPQ